MNSIVVKEVHPSPKKLAQGFVPTKYVAIVSAKAHITHVSSAGITTKETSDIVLHRTHNFNTPEAALAHAHKYCTSRGIALDTDM